MDPEEGADVPRAGVSNIHPIGPLELARRSRHSHVRRDNAGSVVWLGNDTACFPPFQDIVPGKYVTELDCNMTEDVVPLAVQVKLERVATYRQLQGYSNQIYQVTDGKLSLDDFRIPSSRCLGPVSEGEQRTYEDVGDKRLSYLVNK